ncbi:MAG: DUF3301 domain-containing protein [gamma proteobacterium symbiont of Bathyaustriella thionipta]|nr:DUF3301 domain-containing protein [gamma proteobacterium symbiont of Bathyaustriella thionipta]
MLILLISAAIGWFWLSSLRARELANGIGKNLCKRRGYQFLDETVALSRITLARTGQGLRIKRVYSFDYTRAGFERDRGWLMLVGINLKAWSIAEIDNDSRETE